MVRPAVLILKALCRLAAETELTNDEYFSLTIIMNSTKTSSNFHLWWTILNFTSYEDARENLENYSLSIYDRENCLQQSCIEKRSALFRTNFPTSLHGLR